MSVLRGSKLGGLLLSFRSRDGQGKDLGLCGLGGDSERSVGSVDFPQSAPGVNPRSIPAWADAKAFAEGASIDAVARMLGVRNLDQAAALIGFDWRGEAPR